MGAIVERTKVLAAYLRAVKGGCNHEEACIHVSATLCLPLEAVEDAVRESAEEVSS